MTNEDDREFCLIEDSHGGVWWWEYAPDPYDGRLSYLNVSGGGYPTTGKEKVLKTAVAESFDELDWTLTSLKKPKSDTGWLDREGRFYGCGYEAHDMYVHLIFRKKVVEVENSGWIRVHGKQSIPQWSYGGWGTRLSPEQKMWLDRNGYKVEEDD